MSEVFLMKNRLFAFFDILGFSNRLEKESIEVVYQRFSRFLDEAMVQAFQPQQSWPNPGNKNNFEVTYVVSDSIWLVSKEIDDPNAIIDFLFGAIHLMKAAASAALPLRGVIDLADVIWDPSRRIFVSAELPRLSRLEKEQEWCGCYITDKVFEAIREPLFGKELPSGANSLLIKYLVPWKESAAMSAKESYCLNWVTTLPQAERMSLLGFLKGPKLENTSAFIRAVEALSNYSQILDPPIYPVHEFRYLSCRWGANFLFLDHNGVPVDPYGALRITIADDEKSRELVFGSQMQLLIC
jgi:hypothetical protein